MLLVQALRTSSPFVARLLLVVAQSNIASDVRRRIAQIVLRQFRAAVKAYNDAVVGLVALEGAQDDGNAHASPVLSMALQVRAVACLAAAFLKVCDGMTYTHGISDGSRT